MKIFQGRIVGIEVDTVELPDGVRLELEIVRHPGGAAVVAVDENMRVCLLRQYRPVIGAWLWELPAGKIDDGEPPLETARRELAEEAGLAATHWLDLGSIVSSPGVFTERVHLYLARGLSAMPTALEHGELLEPHWIAMSDAVARARNGEIEDAKSIIALFRAATLIGIG
ncbi:MAG: NUDIX hydrolase [Gammaproteobacteria bacterium]|nr:NUDIX hydrolase [Gammaproteobacteria bacterium]